MPKTKAKPRSAPKARPKKRREPRIRAILAAGEQVFMEKGYDAGSLDDVARIANASKATIYAHFGNKIGLFRAIVKEIVAEVLQPLRQDDVDDAPTVEVLRAIGNAFLTRMLSPLAVKFYRLMAAQGVQIPELAQMWFANGPQTAITTLAKFLSDRTARGELRVTDPMQTAEFFLMSLRGVLHLRAMSGLEQNPNPKDIARKVDAAIDMLMRAYGPAPSKRR